MKLKRSQIITHMRGFKNNLAQRARYLGGDKYLTLYAAVFFSNFNYLFYGLSDSGVILKEFGQNLRFSVKNEALTRVQTPSYT